MVIIELFAATALGAGGYTGRVLVDNESGTAVTLQVPDREPLVVAVDEQAVLWLPYGQTTIRATYEQFGRARTLEVETVNVVPRETAYVHLDATAKTRLRVVNDTWLAADLYVNGFVLAHLEPGEREIVRVDVGAVDLELRDDRGHVLERERLSMRPYADNVWTVDLPRTSPVLVSNDNGIPITVEVDGRYVASVGPWDDVRIQVAIGVHRVEVFDARGRLVEDRMVDVSPWEPVRIDVDGPPAAPAPVRPRPPEVHERPHDEHDGYSGHEGRDDDDVGEHCAPRR